ncbi:15373_t:CDS:2 [Acaulospora morrowiae]|uniref:15373_t:CDS:1 n=1 Tax=Acaulospora morrowiae TaxID=94023 RepID=A0A9N9BB68_9GLOM|nr:15373_t:CDS:2 [Acaulospora morrowiae]
MQQRLSWKDDELIEVLKYLKMHFTDFQTNEMATCHRAQMLINPRRPTHSTYRKIYRMKRNMINFMEWGRINNDKNWFNESVLRNNRKIRWMMRELCLKLKKKDETRFVLDERNRTTRKGARMRKAKISSESQERSAQHGRSREKNNGKIADEWQEVINKKCNVIIDQEKGEIKVEESMEEKFFTKLGENKVDAMHEVEANEIIYFKKEEDEDQIIKRMMYFSGKDNTDITTMMSEESTTILLSMESKRMKFMGPLSRKSYVRSPTPSFDGK